MNTFKLKITSPENDDFLMEIEINNEATYLELHNTIQQALAYDNTQMASFFQTDALGERKKEIALFEMSSEEDDNINIVAMDITMIREFLNKENPNMIYVFDFFSDRYFDITLTSITKRKTTTNSPKICDSKGEAPEQITISLDGIEDFNFDEIDLKSTKREDDSFDFMDEFDDDSEDGPKFESLDDYEDIL